jgi:hypothetical protein
MKNLATLVQSAKGQFPPKLNRSFGKEETQCVFVAVWRGNASPTEKGERFYDDDIAS